MRNTFSLASIAFYRHPAAAIAVAALLGACSSVPLPPSAPPPPVTQSPVEQAPETPAIAAPAAPAMTPEQEALRSLVAQQDRLYRVAAPLLVSNTELCKGNARNLLGFTAKNKFSYSSGYTNAAQQALGLDDRLQVMGVLSGSGASRAGLRRGDILAAVEDKPLPQGERAEREAAAMLGPLMAGRSSVKLGVVRGTERLTLNVPLTFACAFSIELGNTDHVNAYGDGRRILVTRGMLGAVRSDEELAYVIAKEMAHNALGHAISQRMVATVGGIIDNLTRLQPDLSTMAGMAGVKPMPQDLDTMADRLALYMLARANYGIDNAVPFWRRMASQYPPAVLNAYTALHPATDARVAAMERTVADITTRRRTQKPILP